MIKKISLFLHSPRRRNFRFWGGLFLHTPQLVAGTLRVGFLKGSGCSLPLSRRHVGSPRRRNFTRKIKIPRFLGRGFLFAFVCVSVGCSPIRVPEENTYSLGNLDSAPTSARPKTHATLLLTNPVADPGYQSSAMVYMKTPYELNTYANSRWIAPPANMLLPLFVQAIRNTSHFYAVISAPYSGAATYRLNTHILRLRQEFLLPVSRVRLTIQAELFENDVDRLIASKRFEAVVSAPANNPYSGVLAANKAAMDVSQQIAQFCARYAVSHRKQ